MPLVWSRDQPQSPQTCKTATILEIAHTGQKQAACCSSEGHVGVQAYGRRLEWEFSAGDSDRIQGKIKKCHSFQISRKIMFSSRKYNSTDRRTFSVSVIGSYWVWVLHCGTKVIQASGYLLNGHGTVLYRNLSSKKSTLECCFPNLSAHSLLLIKLSLTSRSTSRI